MRYDQEGAVRRTKRSEKVGNHAEGVDVQTGVHFVQNDEFGIEHLHLQEFDTALFPARKPDVELAVEKRIGNSERSGLFEEQAFRDERRERFGRSVFSLELGVEYGAEIFGEFHSSGFRERSG